MRFMPPTSPRACRRRAVAEQTARYSPHLHPSPLLSTRRVGEATDFPPLSKALQVHREIGKLSPRVGPHTAKEERLNCLCPPHRHLAARANWVSSAAQSGLSPTGELSEKYQTGPSSCPQTADFHQEWLRQGCPTYSPLSRPKCLSFLFPFQSSSRMSGFSVPPGSHKTAAFLHALLT